MRTLLAILIVFGLYFNPDFAYSQDGHRLSFRYLSIEEGLSQNTVNCIFKDNRGFMWFGTNDGLNRWDGYEFTIYRYNAHDKNSIKGNKIYDIAEDAEGILWIGSRTGGLSRYDRQKDTFTSYLHNQGDTASISSNFVSFIFADDQNKLWVGTLGGGLNLFDRETETFQRIHFFCKGEYCDQQLPFKELTSILQDKHGRFWIAGYYPGIALYDPISQTLHMTPFDSLEKNENHMVGKSLFEDSEGRIWICTEGHGFYVFNPEKNSFENYTKDNSGLNDNIVKQVIQRSQDEFWLATDGGGINIFNLQKQSFAYIQNDNNIPGGLSSNAVYSMYEDDQNILWVGTFGAGINLHHKQNQQFRHYWHHPVKNYSLSHRAVLSICEDATGLIWIGTDGGGLNAFNPETQRFIHYKHDEGDPNSLSSNAVTSLLKVNKEELWIGTYQGGLSILNPETGAFRRYYANLRHPNALQGEHIWALLKDSRDRIWIGSLNGGLHLYRSETDDFLPVRNSINQPEKFVHRVTCLAEDTRGNIWIGGTGLSRMNPETLEFITFWHNPNDENSLSSNDIRCIFQDSKNRIWIGTEGGGLNWLLPDEKSFRVFNTYDGLPNDVIHSIQEDDYGNLWMSTNKGLCKFDPDKLIFKSFDRSDGLQSNEFSYNASWKTKNGEMYFGGVNGFNVFNPASIQENPVKPKVYITGFQINNKPLEIGAENSPLTQHISETRYITLTHKQSVISIEYTALNFISSEKNQYAYILEGFIPEWTYAGTRRMATYTNLQSGDYIFRVKASNNDGVWNDEGAFVHIKVLPPPWKTSWAYLIYTMTFIFLLYSFRKFANDRAQMKNNIRIKELEKQKIDEVAQTKLRFFTNISHELRTPLTLIIGPLEKLMEDQTLTNNYKNHFSIMQRNARRLLRMVNQLMEFRKMEKGKMDLSLKQENIISFVRNIKEAFNDFALQHKMNYNFSSNCDKLWMYCDVDKLDKIFYNLLSNAFKFTPDGGSIFVAIEHQPEKSRVNIIVQDNGIGISRERITKIFDRFYKINQDEKLRKSIEQESSGIGLSHTKELIEMHNGSILVESQEGKGSKFVVSLPLDKSLFKPEDFVEYRTLEQDDLRNKLMTFLDEEPLQQDTEEILNIDDGLKQIDKPLVLIVDDNRDIRRFIKICLEENHRTIEAENGSTGLDKALKYIPDLIISDIMMPVTDGIEFCRKIKEREETCHIPVVLLTAWDSTERHIAGFQTGGDDYITKPFDSNILLARVQNLIISRKRLRDLFKKNILLEPAELTIESADDQFIKKAVKIVEDNISDPDFDVRRFVREIGMSRSVLYRKLQAVTNQSANEFIRLIRLKRAAQLLKKTNCTIAEVSSDVGFNDPQYFSKCFSRQFGKTPSEYANQGKVVEK
jgi:signal transduction histidine kinase/ligand-binding sensor domain-containing protein/AraC-like DNA-binding protein